MDDLTAQRERMVDQQIQCRGVRDPRVLEAMRQVPREVFVSESLREVAYRDSPLPIGAGQTISQPYIVALMIEAAQLQSGDRALEIGAGSGYAAAVMAQIAAQVYAIERHDELAEQARERLARLGYANVELRCGDGSGGWPDAGPFDAILAAAGGPEVPSVLRRQLAIGGRLVMPVGSRHGDQRLLKLTRVDEASFDEEELGGVLFVPLIGAHGWDEDGRPAPTPEPPTHEEAATRRDTSSLIAEAIEPLPDFDDSVFGEMFDRFARARVVLLGEASHGSSEFYRARDAITRRLVERHGFTIVAVEADWPDAAAVDRHIRGKPVRPSKRPVFSRFPTWMWRNTEVAALVAWLRRHNASAAQPAGFYGLDLYSLNSSIEAVIDYLEDVDPQAAKIARQRYGCFAPWAADPAEYGRMAISQGYAHCEAPVLAMLRELLDRQVEDARGDGEQWFDAAQNARLIRNAEAYYRAMYYGAAESWNLRDTHMFETLQNLLHAHGDDSRAVVWAHNSHIGDARHTEMGQVREELNLGQLCREHYGDDAVLVGFGTHAGTVAAASDWGAPMQVMDVRPSREDSVEHLFHRAGVKRGLLPLRDGNAMLCQRLRAERLQRFIGVVYRPQTERWSHYADASLAQQFDAWVWFERTRAVEPLPAPETDSGAAETWPFGV